MQLVASIWVQMSVKQHSTANMACAALQAAGNMPSNGAIGRNGLMSGQSRGAAQNSMHVRHVHDIFAYVSWRTSMLLR